MAYFSRLFLQTSSEHGERQIRVYIIKTKLHGGLEIFYFLALKAIFYMLHSFAKYCFYHSKVKFVSLRRRVISSFCVPCIDSGLTSVEASVMVRQVSFSFADIH